MFQRDIKFVYKQYSILITKEIFMKYSLSAIALVVLYWWLHAVGPSRVRNHRVFIKSGEACCPTANLTPLKRKAQDRKSIKIKNSVSRFYLSSQSKSDDEAITRAQGSGWSSFMPFSRRKSEWAYLILKLVFQSTLVNIQDRHSEKTISKKITRSTVTEFAQS